MEFTTANSSAPVVQAARGAKIVQDPRLASSTYMNVVPMMTPNVPPPNMMPMMGFRYDLSLPPLIPATLKTDDELLVETWLSKIGKINLNLESDECGANLPKVSSPCKRQVKPKGYLSIHAAKESLKKCLEITSQLEACQKILEENLTTMSTDEWKQHTHIIGVLKDELSMLMTQFQNPDVMQILTYEISQRKKKRATHKRRKVELRLQAVRKREENLLEHKRIDLWLAAMKEDAERVKLEETVKKDADCVLAAVTRKKTEARRQLSLITALIKLRNVREVAAKARGERIPAEDNAAFCKTTEMLIKMWENSLRMYGLEEQGLRRMLEKSASEDTAQVRATKEREVVEQWERALFGPAYVPSALYWPLTAAQRDMEKFIAIRRSWDTFLTHADDADGSRIPLGWVLPRGDAGLEWVMFRQS